MKIPIEFHAAIFAACLSLASTSVRAAVVYSNNFEAPVGSEWSSTATTTTPIAGRRFLGEFDAQSVSLSLPSTLFPADTTQVTLEFDLFVLRSWDGNPVAGGNTIFDRWTLRAVNNTTTTLLDTTFSNNTGISGFDRQAYPQAIGVGDNAARSGADENNSLGFIFDGATRDSVYYFRSSEAPDTAFSFSYSPGANVVFQFVGGQNEGISTESWGIDNVVVSASSVPEPASVTLLLFGAAFCWRRRSLRTNERSA